MSLIAAKSFPDYERPPIAEVACGVRFKDVVGFTLPHSGLYWETIRRDFPECQHAEPLVEGSVISVDPQTGIPLPRIWFLSKDKRALIQLQRNCFIYNWRKIDETDAYPRFESINVQFKKRFSDFNLFLNSSSFTPAKPTRIELAYVNFIPKGQGWNSMDDIGNLFLDLVWSKSPSRFLPSPTGLSWQIQFPMSDSAGTLNVRLANAIRATDSTQALRLEIQAISATAEYAENAMYDWFNLAHEWIVKAFGDLTNPTAQKDLWGRKDVG